MQETRIITTNDLRNLCIRNDWFTCGDNEEYDKLFDMVRGGVNLTTNKIVEIAEYILQFSDTDYYLEAVCSDLVNISYSVFSKE